MNKILATIAAATIAVSAPAARVHNMTWPDGSFNNPRVERTPTSLVLTMDINPAAFTMKSNHQVWLRPAVVGVGDTLWFNPVVVAGRTRYLQNERHHTLPDNAIQLHAGSTEQYAYQAIVPFQDWMERCDLVLTGTVSSCCGNGLGPLKPDQPLASCDFRDKTLRPVMVYVSPTKEIVKTRTVSGQAYIDFPVGKMQIYPDYRRNPAELAEIRRTIDEVRNDRDITITSISFTGYASPEGSYALNERLAKGRTEALIEYVRNLYAFPRDVMHSSWVAEDWAGLESKLAAMEIDNKAAIMAIVTDSEMAPDVKDLKIKRDYPVQYAYLLENVYPALRHSDYKVEYTIRNYVDVTEIAAVMASAPQKLSLDELFLYAKSLDKDSPEFREVMEVAVRMYPDDPEANLNAATTAASFGDYDKAREYLAKAGNGPVATYTLGVIEARQGNYAGAAPLLQKAADAGIAEAAQLLAFMKEMELI